MTRDENNRSTKAICGPGGLNCSCCRVGSRRDAKVLHRRLLRHRINAALRTEVIHGEKE